MINNIGLKRGLQHLHDSEMLILNEARVVRKIDPGNQEAVFGWLIWASFEVEPVVEPPTFEAALISRKRNISDAFRWLDDLPARNDRRITWYDAFKEIDGLGPNSVDLARTVVAEFLSTSS